MEEKFDKTKYIIEYRKKHKKQFNVDLNNEEMEELEKMLSIANLTKAQFLRNAVEDLRKRIKKDK